MGVREALLGAAPPTEVVAVPELKIQVTVRGMTGAERDAFEAGCVAGRGKRRELSLLNVRAKVVAFCCLDEQGARLFSDADAEALGHVRADVIDRLFAVASRLSGMREQDLDELGLGSESPTTSSTSSSVSLSN